MVAKVMNLTILKIRYLDNFYYAIAFYSN